MPDERGFPSPAEVPSVYVSNARLMGNHMEFRLYIGETIPETLPAAGVQFAQVQSRVADRICLVFTPETGSAIAKLLVEGVQKFVAQHGPLRIPSVPKTSEVVKPEVIPPNEAK
jgi:hypothetical protein